MSTWSIGLPRVGARVQLLNPVTDEIITGYCYEHLATQWVIAESLAEDAGQFVVHRNWKWRYF